MKKILCLFGLLSILASCNNIEEIKPNSKSSNQIANDGTSKVNDEILNRLISKYNLKVGNDLNKDKKFKSMKRLERIEDLEKFLDDRNDAFESIVGKEFQNEVKVTKSSARIAGTLKYIDITVYVDWSGGGGYGGLGTNVSLRIQFTIDDQTGRIVHADVTADVYGGRYSTASATVSHLKYDHGIITFNLDLRQSSLLDVGEIITGHVGTDGVLYSTVTYVPGTTWIHSRFKSFGYGPW